MVTEHIATAQDPDLDFHVVDGKITSVIRFGTELMIHYVADGGMVEGEWADDIDFVGYMNLETQLDSEKINVENILRKSEDTLERWRDNDTPVSLYMSSKKLAMFAATAEDWLPWVANPDAEVPG